MGGNQEPEADAGKAAGYPSFGLPPSAPPALEGPPRHQYQYGYGTFQGSQAGSAEFRQPLFGYSQPPPPPVFGGGGGGYHHHQKPYYGQSFQPAQGYGEAVEGRPERTQRLPCGPGLAWFLFIAGFFIAAIPWYVGAFILICAREHDDRGKPGYVACTIALSRT